MVCVCNYCRNFREYRKLKCKLECTISTIIKYCNCLPYYYGKYVQRENVPICNFTQIKCLIDNYCTYCCTAMHHFPSFYGCLNTTANFHYFFFPGPIHGNRKNYSLNCDCLPNCNDYSYEFSASEAKLHQNKQISVDEFM